MSPSQAELRELTAELRAAQARQRELQAHVDGMRDRRLALEAERQRRLEHDQQIRDLAAADLARRMGVAVEELI